MCLFKRSKTSKSLFFPTYLYASLLFFLFLLAGWQEASWSRTDPIQVDYRIDDRSQLFIKGSSNVTLFTCVCTNQFPDNSLLLKMDEQQTIITFQEAELEFLTESLDCGKKAMNKDMYETLKAESYPAIKIDIRQAKSLSEKLLLQNDEWLSFDTEAVITIAGESRSIPFEVKGKKNGENSLHFTSSFSILLSDFGLRAPRPLFGLIKVDDRIQIFMDLIVEV